MCWWSGVLVDGVLVGWWTSGVMCWWAGGLVEWCAGGWCVGGLVD